jgi:phage shock protein PspC (stress-responsive transcriptional regulator)
MAIQRQRLYRSRANRVVSGICGGLGEYLNADPTIIRLAWILLTLLGGSGIILYIVAYFVIPLKPLVEGETVQSTSQDFTPGRILGIIFIAVGMVILLDNLDLITFHHWWNLLIKRGKTVTSSSTQQTQEPSEPSQSTQPNVESTRRRTLHRSYKDKKILGICGGMGEYFEIDPTIVRIAYVFFTLFTGGVGLVLYFLLYLIIPEDQPQSNKP